MDVFATFATDEKLETEGVWFDLSATAKVLVARSGNEKYLAVLRKVLDRNQLALDANDEAANTLAQQLTIDAMAEAILLGWEGLSFQGKQVPYSKDMAKTMLRVKDFRARIEALSKSFEAYKVKAEEAQGND
jgi:hypothetical protein